VRDDQAGGARFAQQGQSLLLQPLAHLHVETGERLVHQHHGRPRHNGPCQRHALLLAAGENVGVVPRVALEADAGERGKRLAAGILLGERLEAEGDVGEDAQVREECEVLEHQADVAFLRGDEAGRACHLRVVDEHAPAGRPLDACGQAQQSGLAAARWSQQADDLGRCDVEREAGNRQRGLVTSLHGLEGEARGERRRRATGARLVCRVRRRALLGPEPVGEVHEAGTCWQSVTLQPRSLAACRIAGLAK